MGNEMKLLFAVVPALIFGGEYALKNYVEKNVKKENKKILGGSILVRKHHNRGAVLNFGEQKRKAVALLSLLLTVLLTIVFIMTFTKHGNSWLKAGLSLLLGGAFSNTYDRLKREYVVDYFSFNVKWEPLRNIVFNLSDFCILIGAMMAALHV